MTGILPIKKYGSHSALNMFDEFSMTNLGALAEYVGFTEKEVKELCGQFDMSFEDTKRWYDGYDFSRKEVFIPNSEITTEFITSIRDAGWQEVVTAIRNSEELLRATWKLDNTVVAEKIQEADFSLLKNYKKKDPDYNNRSHLFMNGLTTFLFYTGVLLFLYHN